MADSSLSQSAPESPAVSFSALGAAFSVLQASIEQALSLATQAARFTDAPLSADERAHVRYVARMALALVSQPVSRKIDAAVKAKIEAVVLEAAASAKEFNEDHSYGYLASQAIDRMANRLLAEDVPLLMREAAYDAIGGLR